ncbi:MAG TPA: FISUMP domain-containing protein [Candidatus Kapabacteria bacterium]|nr:FISUMP domain-containing protein [Candidatus Kapabacteria bacterium]
MKTLKLLALAALAFLFAACKATQPTGPPSGSSGPSVGEVISTLNTTQSKFYALAQANLGKSPQQVMMLTAAWLQTQPNVQHVDIIDSIILDIELNSGLNAIFQINLVDANGSLTRGGGHTRKPLRFGPIVPATHALQNKNVLIYCPFIAQPNFFGAPDLNALYNPGEIDSVVNIFKKSNQGFNVTLSVGDSVGIINAFGDYGIVIIDTHGLPFGFYSSRLVGSVFYYNQDSLYPESEVKANLDEIAGPGVYEAMQNGSIFMANEANLQQVSDWQTFLNNQKSRQVYQLVIGSKYIAALPPMPNTIIVGNFCYSGWANDTTTKSPFYAAIHHPIYTAFTSLQPLAYYSYGYPDGTSGLLDNTFGKRMEDSLAQALVVYGDSTGFAYKMADGFQYTAQRLLAGGYSPNMPFNHYGPDNYSYMPCLDSFTDARDGQLYHTVCEGNQIWMRDNLNFNAPGSFTYDNSPANGALYGRIYPWKILMNGASSSDSTPSGVRGLCPYGWHIPSQEEWMAMEEWVAYNEDSLHGPVSYALQLNSSDTNKGGWLDDAGATNSSGFSALAGGDFSYAQGKPQFSGIHHSTLFLSSNIDPKLGTPSNLWLYYTGAYLLGAQISSNPTDPNQPSANGYCRCVKDP